MWILSNRCLGQIAEIWEFFINGKIYNQKKATKTQVARNHNLCARLIVIDSQTFKFQF